MILRIYEYFTAHRSARWTSLLCLTAVLAALVMRLSYQEDISAFLPLDKKDREALNIYQDISGANRLFVIFGTAKQNNETASAAKQETASAATQETRDASASTQATALNPDTAKAAIDLFCTTVEQRDTAHWTADMTAQFDMESLAEMQTFVYTNIPYFLTTADYHRMDSLLATPGYLDRQLAADHEMLLFPSGGLLQDNLSRDPLNLFTPVLMRLQGTSVQNTFEMDDGYIFTPDMSRAIVMLSSPFGNAETENNGKLIALLDSAIHEAQQAYPTIEAHVVGGPQIAVGNATQIKTDSIVAVVLSAILILSLLFYSIRSLRNILLIALSIGWGMLFALGGMALLHDSVSIIVIGISSVILGIAVNYPLHLVAHSRHEPDMRRSLREIISPLVIGNITTVGAFLALVPLESTALRDLGLFASLLLIGTILFVLLYLPHHVKTARQQKDIKLLTRIAAVRLEEKRWLLWTAAVLTAVFTWYSLGTEFDTDMANINYMTAPQREDMNYFQRLTAANSSATTEPLYIVSSASTIDEALDKSLATQPIIEEITAQAQQTAERSPSSAAHTRPLLASDFLSSQKEQARRLALWRAFVSKHQAQLTTHLTAAAKAQGFSPEAFADFAAIVSAQYRPRQFDYFKPLTTTVFAANVSIDAKAGRYSIVDKLPVEQHDMARIKARFPHAFDVKSMNGALAATLANDFNYIGFACSAIVFFFLWFSFGRIELALLSFLPMAVSWLWILGIMTLMGIKFNIVNIILATFIFGQGDDYTIFMTEGCQYEYAHRRPLLASYKSSIVLSALIMFIGIGTLIVAKHPALHSLAEITIIGMFSVVLMAWTLPPLVFNWMTRHADGTYRRRPLTLARLLRRALRLPEPPESADDYRQLVLDRYLYKGTDIQCTVRRSLATTAQVEAIKQLRPDANGEIHIPHCGYGATALLAALLHPAATIIATDPDAEKTNVLRISAQDIVSNIRIS